MPQQLQLTDIELHVFDEGTGDPIIFVHGFPLDHTMWQAQLEEFSSTHRVIAPDLRGFGQSEDSAGTVTMEKFSDDLAEMLELIEVKEPVTLCGLSMGGYIAWQFWKRHPQKLARLILCDTRALPDTPGAKKDRLDGSEKVLDQGPGFLAEGMPQKLYAPQTHIDQPELIEATKRTIMSNSPAGISAAMRGMAVRPDVTSWLPEIQVPTLVIVGEHDAISTAEEMTAIADKIPNSTLAIIPGAGHMAPQERPELVNEAIHAFLK
ncbi:alpha/beta fold hydrolase [Planctomicrobium sp. SH661]|uniref:alpha/beta fold hydrolase n=1 Tax=Planctomicrobium sp. SH661 TaxID=3448124 RepID=UPI003F5C2265